MDEMDPQPPSAADETFRPVRKSRVPWLIVIVGVLAAAFAVWLYLQLDQKGLTIRGPGHLVVLPYEKGGAWALFADGGLIELTQASVARLKPASGPCELIEGTVADERLELDTLTCTPGPLQKSIGDRIRWMGLKFAYWDRSLPFSGDTLEPYLQTPEVIASMVDSRPIAPQLVPMFNAFFPSTLAEARRSGRLPPPLVLHTQRDDLKIVRMTRPELALFLARPKFFFAGGAAEGGWLVRTVELDPGAPAAIEDLLLTPAAAPWPEMLKNKVVRVQKRTAPPEAAAPAASAPAAP